MIRAEKFLFWAGKGIVKCSTTVKAVCNKTAKCNKVIGDERAVGMRV